MKIKFINGMCVCIFKDKNGILRTITAKSLNEAFQRIGKLLNIEPNSARKVGLI